MPLLLCAGAAICLGTGMVQVPRGQDDFLVAALLLPLPLLAAGWAAQRPRPSLPTACVVGAVLCALAACLWSGALYWAGPCAAAFSVTDPADPSVDHLYARLRSSLSRSWPLDTTGRGCRPTGRLVDRTRLCVHLFPQPQPMPGHVLISIEDVRPGQNPWPGGLG